MGRHIVKYKIDAGTLPSGYEQLEYITSTGTLYIDTGSIKPWTTSNYEIKITATLNRLYNYQGLLTSHTPSSVHESWVYGAGGVTYRRGGTRTVDIPVLDNTKYDFIYSGDGNNVHTLSIYTNGGLVDTKSVTVTETVNESLLLYRCSASGTMSDMNIYYTSIKQDGVLVEEFIPAKRLSDNVVGMYGKTTNTFYQSAVSGTNFVAGPSLVKEVRGLVVAREGEAPPEMPTGYTAVKAIKSSGYQYFQTSWIPDFTKDIIIDGDVGFVTILRGMWFANYGSTGQTFSVELYNNFYSRFYCDSDVINISTGIGLLNTLAHVTYNYTASTGALTLSCSTGAAGSGTIPSGRRVKHTSAVWFGTDNFSGHRFPYGYFGKLKITEGGVDVIDYQPCKRDSDGVYGMYDFVNNTFYPSSTGTNFLLGEAYVNTITPHAIKTREVNN